MWLILVGAVASAIQQFRGSSQWAGGINRSEVPPTLAIGGDATVTDG